MRTEKQLLENALALINAAACPQCDGSGVNVYETGGIGMGGENDTRECHQEQCQWCYERNELMRETEAHNA